MEPMPRVPPLDRPATYDDLERLPEIVVAEILDGELHATPRPAPRHAITASAIGIEIGGPFYRGRGGPGGWWILDEPELHLGQNVVVPDLAGWRRDRMSSLPEQAYFSASPDWVCEVLSPSTAALDRVTKLRIYAAAGVGHAWLVDPVARTLEIFRLDEGRWLRLAAHGGSEVVRAEPFAEIDLPLPAFWADPA
jgi:Uma2 family endonuclease